MKFCPQLRGSTATLLLSVVCSFPATSRAEEPATAPAWLTAVVTPPPNISADAAGPLKPLLHVAGKPVSSVAEWEIRRSALRREWMQFLGEMPEFHSTSFEILQTGQGDGFTRTRIRYESEPGEPAEAWLLVPQADPPADGWPGIVALHQTTNSTIDQIAGVSDSSPQAYGPELARRGFVVLCPMCFLWRDMPSLNAAVDRFRSRHPGCLGMRKMLFDAMRAVDLLAAMKSVNPNRIGAIGHSLGAKEVLYLAAFDERVKASVASEGGVVFRSTNWNAPWYLGPAIEQPGFERNHHELLALAAPRRVLILGGESGPGAADGDRSWPLLMAAQPVFRLYDAAPRLGLLNHRKGHAIPADALNRSVDWLRMGLDFPQKKADN